MNNGGVLSRKDVLVVDEKKVCQQVEDLVRQCVGELSGRYDLDYAEQRLSQMGRQICRSVMKEYLQTADEAAFSPSEK